MRKIVLSTLFVSLFFVAQAQTEKDSFLAGGTGRLEFAPGFSMTLAPQIGYFVADNIAVGTGMQLVLADSDFSRRFGLFPFARYYFGSISNRTRPLVEARTGVLFQRGGPYDFFGLGGGVTHFFNDHVALEALLNYNFDGTASDSDASRLGIDVGFQIYFGRK